MTFEHIDGPLFMPVLWYRTQRAATFWKLCCNTLQLRTYNKGALAYEANHFDTHVCGSHTHTHTRARARARVRAYTAIYAALDSLGVIKHIAVKQDNFIHSASSLWHSPYVISLRNIFSGFIILLLFLYLFLFLLFIYLFIYLIVCSPLAVPAISACSFLFLCLPFFPHSWCLSTDSVRTNLWQFELILTFHCGDLLFFPST